MLALHGRSRDAVLRTGLAGARTASEISGLDELAGKSNYFIGSDPRNWRAHVPAYAKVRYREPYPGIDLIYYGNQRQLEYDFVVAPGADPKSIRVRLNGARKMRIAANGDLVLQVGGDELRFHKPVVYQAQSSSGGWRQFVEGRYRLTGKHEVGFEIAAYDTGRPLIIDPVLSYSTYLGGGGDDNGYAIAVDGSGNAYVTGSTGSTDFPTANPLMPTNQGRHDAFVTVFDPTGSTLLYSTYLGGGDQDGGLGITVDGMGNAYLTGYSYSTDFPTVNAWQSIKKGMTNAFVAVLDPTGSTLLYSTYLGGSGEDFGNGIAVDGSGNMYVTGQTTSTDFPTANPRQAANAGMEDAFVAALDPTGSTLRYSTYLGGSGNDYGYGIPVDSAGNAYVAGHTASFNFPTANAFQPGFGGVSDAFVAALDPTGSTLLYSTYLGGSFNDGATAIAVDSAGDAYVTGYTGSTNFPTSNPLQSSNHGGFDAFVAALDPTGATLLYATYLGGSGDDFGAGIALDGAGNTYLTGQTLSTDFPTVNPVQPANHGNRDSFVTAVDSTGSTMLYSTYLGGSDGDYVQGIAVYGSGNAYVVGYTQSRDYPTANAFQPSSHANPGSWNVFVSGIAP